MSRNSPDIHQHGDLAGEGRRMTFPPLSSAIAARHIHAFAGIGYLRHGSTST
ncbi:hypothetical protein [Dactylosporangium sp. NPDC005555]|uniref:hypothetical protein n=1 Tax=Dactylosporangium sp. NPDC005555 TaxID=3154889 RepID=UPI0033A0ECA6